MKLLALEFSSSPRSVAVWDAPTGMVAEVVDTTAGPTMKPFAMIESALQQAGLEREQIEGIAVGLGPGSYTGIRAAIALAQGWQLARGTPLTGISSVECIVSQAAQEGIHGKVSVVIDAQRGEFYLAGYELSAGGVRSSAPLRIVTAESVRALERAGEMLIGPEVTRWFAPGRTVSSRAARLAKLAAERVTAGQSENLEPIYLRETTFIKAPPPRILPD